MKHVMVLAVGPNRLRQPCAFVATKRKTVLKLVKDQLMKAPFDLLDAIGFDVASDKRVILRTRRNEKFVIEVDDGKRGILEEGEMEGPFEKEEAIDRLCALAEQNGNHWYKE